MKEESKFSVEGHGAGTLTIHGNPGRRARAGDNVVPLTRKWAWELAKEMMRRGDTYHTVYVKDYTNGNRTVFTARWDSQEGAFVDAKTLKRVKL